MKLALFAIAAVNSASAALGTVQAPPAEDDAITGKNLRFHWGNVNERWVEPLQTPLLSNITRKEVMARAEEWVTKQIPYCQCNGPAECCGNCPYCGTYRCDCSGYVSYTWKLGTGYTTRTLSQVATQISKSQLEPGDIMLNQGLHVAIFGGWTDSTHTKFYAYQEPGCHTSGVHHAYKSAVTYPFNWSPDSFKPYRYNHIVD